MAGVRLQKVLAQAGHGSRRQVEAWIKAGQVVVNGKVAQIGDRIDAQAVVRINGRQVTLQSSKRRVLA